MPAAVDAAIAGEYIAFTLGTHRDTIRMSFADFERLAKPSVGPIAMEQEVLV